MEFDSYSFIIAASLVVIASFFFNIFSSRTNVPSVLLLITLGIILKLIAEWVGIEVIELFPVLEVLGIVGLIMIVLEASLELELKKEKRNLILKSFSVALLGLVINALAIAAVIQQFLHTDYFVALIYAIPLSIMSSAIIIPSVSSLQKDKKEFMVYESTFSDTLGIMFFFFLIESVHAENLAEISLSIGVNILLTLIISVALSYILIYLFQKLQSEVKLFLLIAVLILLYAIGKLLHFSSLVMILVFGLILNNHQYFFRGKLKNFINTDSIRNIYKNFHVITIESSFVVRTFFFVIFGMTIMLSSLIDLNVIVSSIIILGLIYGSRYLLFRLILGKDILPQILIAPRGLITILLFFAIPEEYMVAEFKPGILLFIIIISSIIMAYSLIKAKKSSQISINADQSPELEIIDKRSINEQPAQD